MNIRHISALATLALLSLISLPTEAINNKVVADTIISIATPGVQVGPISVKQIKVKGKRVDVYSTPGLSYVSLRQSQTDSLRRAVSTAVLGHPNGQVHIFSDGHELSELLTTSNGQRRKQAFTVSNTTPLTRCVSRPYTAEKGLEGRHIALYGSHGRYFYQQQQRWLWQRAKILTTVEDLYTTSYTMPFLVPMLENAGAVVIQARERDRQEHEVIVDEQDSSVRLSETWTHVADGGWGRSEDGLLYEGENPFSMGGYAWCKTSSKMQDLTYTPQLPEEGEYAVYVSYKSEPGSTNAALYTIVHKGIRTTYEVNQQMGGSTWVYLGTFAFGTDSATNHVVVSDKHKSGHILTSDAIRFGGGMGNVARYAQADLLPNVPSAQENGSQQRSGNAPSGTRNGLQDISYVSGSPRWLEGARYWFQYCGIPDSVYNYTGGKNDYTDDYASRGRWINYLAGGSSAYPKGPGLHIPVELGLAFHTDAGTTPDDTIIGTLLIYTEFDDEKHLTFPNGASRMLNRDYADYMQSQLVNDVRATFAPEWHRRQLKNSSYAESRNPKVPTVLLEFLSHQNFADMKYGLDPSFRFVVSRAIYKSMLRFNHEQYGTPYVVQPLPVQQFAIRFADGMDVTLSWQPREDQLEPTAMPDYYIVYTRLPGQDWDNGVLVRGTSATLTQEPGIQYEYKVCAGNDGGISFPSPVLTACRQEDEYGRVLIVNGFNRISGPEYFQSADSTIAGILPGAYGVGYMNEVNYIGEQYEFNRSLPWVSDDNCGFGTCYTDKQGMAPVGNTFDYPTMHGRELAKMGYSFVSCQVDALDSISSRFDMVDIILGKQKRTEIGSVKKTVKYELFPDNLRRAIINYKGAILVSGSYLGSEMQSTIDAQFASKYLHYKFGSSHASRSGLVNMQLSWQHAMQAHMPAGSNLSVPREVRFMTELNKTILPCESPEGLLATDKQSFPVARYNDSGVAAGIASDGAQRTLVFGFVLESLGEDFSQLYPAVLRWLTKQ